MFYVLCLSLRRKGIEHWQRVPHGIFDESDLSDYEDKPCLKPDLIINVVDRESGMTELHHATQNLELTELFLRYGTRTDVRCKKNGMLPLTRACLLIHEGFAAFEDFELKRCHDLNHWSESDRALLSFHVKFFKLLGNRSIRYWLLCKAIDVQDSC
ncbi:hypothetical protein DM860_012806 [Cuscuta australis]|uniref:Uncharacterized protein n=1 Tax=Cuscuta australis TaxID=267555 RepID=A0A328DYX4_9ASTE|nr:hypothetical protein DM860_012806 [Cuscuta australis]